ncbi:hypothetical protein YB2330_002040 [Saitoella coloradoensis]
MPKNIDWSRENELRFLLLCIKSADKVNLHRVCEEFVQGITMNSGKKKLRRLTDSVMGTTTSTGKGKGWEKGRKKIVEEEDGGNEVQVGKRERRTSGTKRKRVKEEESEEEDVDVEVEDAYENKSKEDDVSEAEEEK